MQDSGGEDRGSYTMIVCEVVEILPELSPPRLLRRIEAWIRVGLFHDDRLGYKGDSPLKLSRP